MSKKVTPQAVADEILEATMLTSQFAGKDNRLAKLTRRKMRFKTAGSLEEGNLSFSYTFPDGTKAEYALIHGTFSTRTGFQAAAFEKTTTAPGGEKHSSVKLIFPGTARRSQFSDLNAFDTFWMKRIGSHIHNTKEWLETEVMPRISEGNNERKNIEISSHCLGTQSALWAKAYLEEERHRRVTGVALLEPTAPGLVLDDIISDLKSVYNIYSRDAIQDLYRNVYSVFVDPPTIVCPFGAGNMWDTVPVGEQSFIIHLPPTKLYEELGKTLARPHVFRAELKEKLKSVNTDLKEKKEEFELKKHSMDTQEIEEAEQEIKAIEKSPQTKAFFKTALGTEIGQQFFRNHYLLSLTNQILDPNKRLKEIITESHTPDAAAMLAHRAPNLGRDMEQRLKQLMTANIVNTGRDIANVMTNFCLRGGRMGIPRIVEPDYLWSTSQILTEDDTVAENYPPSFFKNVAIFKLNQLVDRVIITIAIIKNKEITRPLEEAFAPIIKELSAGQIPSPLSTVPNDLVDERFNEVQARAIVKHLPLLRTALRFMEKQNIPEKRNCVLAIAALEEADKNLKRAYSIKPEHETVRYR